MACGGGVPVGRPAHATGGAHGWCSRVGRRHATRAKTRRAARAVARGTTVVSSGSAVANYVCASATVCVCRRRVCRVFREPMAARTDADRRKRGRVPAIGDWADGVHRGVARASSPKRRPKTQGQGRAAGRVNGAGVEVSKRNRCSNPLAHEAGYEVVRQFDSDFCLPV